MFSFWELFPVHLFLPIHSCHAPGVLPGLVFGNILRIYQLCSDACDVVKEIKLFLHRLLDRGYQLDKLTSLFQKVMDNAKDYLQCTALDHLCAKSSKETSHCQQVFLHLPYYPANPSSKTIQKLWASGVATPPGQPPFRLWSTSKGTLSPLSASPLLGIARPTWATSCPTGNYITAWGWKSRPSSWLGSSMPLIFWAEDNAA
jgi:hypothetical protein